MLTLGLGQLKRLLEATYLKYIYSQMNNRQMQNRKRQMTDGSEARSIKNTPQDQHLSEIQLLPNE
jgi:hypothetical protein